jgi:hypothetical protein
VFFESCELSDKLSIPVSALLSHLPEIIYVFGSNKESILCLFESYFGVADHHGHVCVTGILVFALLSLFIIARIGVVNITFHVGSVRV